MRVVAFSDSHRNHRNVSRLFEQTCLTTDVYIFLGDGEDDLDGIRALYPEKTILQVAGNCDIGSKEARLSMTELAGKKIVFCHGHMQGVRYGISGLCDLARQTDADVVLYGHTHERRCDYIDGVYYINPGSIGLPRDGLAPSYAAIDILPSGILCTHAELE